MTDTRQFSEKWVKGVFGKALAPHLDEGLKAKLKAIGIDVAPPYAPSYARQAWLDGLALVANERFADEPDAGARLRRLGGQLVKVLADSGKINGAALTMAKLFGAKRVLKELVSQAAAGTNYLQFNLQFPSSREASLRFNDAAVADFLGGALQAVLSAVGAKNPQVVAQVVGDDRAVLTLTWA
ncbi:MAG: DUF2378 family protein [Myxococcaceae bacterium]|nr:DUF2378 family protein [Myxococcaceae bacterium]